MRAQTMRAIRYAFSMMMLLAGSCAAWSNPTQLENAKPGTSEWRITNLAEANEIEGYASATSVNRGEQISLFVNTQSPTYTLEIFRMGWYGGLGGRRITEPVLLTGVHQTIPTLDPVTGLIECNWTNPYTFTIPATDDWPSGGYVAKLTETAGGKQRYIVFVVRDDSRNSDYVFQTAVNTYQAYNPWGGKSLYNFNSTGGAASKVSFNRPYATSFGDDGAGDFVEGWEYNMVRFLEREGYDVTYVTDVDVHNNPGILLSHHAHLIVGHNEYWTWEMRQGFIGARDAGMGIGVFGGDTMYWQVRYEPSTVGAQPNRTIVGYKDFALTKDPYALDGISSNNNLITTYWNSATIGLPEDALIGVGFVGEQIHTDIVVTNPTHWVFANTGLTAGAHIFGLLGYEVDAELGHQPSNTVVLAHSPFTSGNTSGFSDMTIYTSAAGGLVFATGTIEWSWGLDNYHSLLQNPASEQITRNVLARLIGNQPPTANPGGPYTGKALIAMNFDASLSSDADGTITEYEWDFGDGLTGQGVSVSHTYAEEGVYDVTLKVRDNRGSTNVGTTTANIALPDPHLSLTPAQYGFAPQLVGTVGGPISVRVKNLTNVPVDFVAFHLTGDFAQDNNCPGTLGALEECTVSVTFHPSAAGARTGTFTIESTAVESPQSVQLSGTGKDPLPQTPDQIGQWSAVLPLPGLAVHAHLLPTDDVFFFSELGDAHLWKIANDTFQDVPYVGWNLHCTAHTFMRDGRMLITGGHIADLTGLPHTVIYNPFTGAWSTQVDMRAARWYASEVSMPNGDVIVIGGEVDPATGVNRIPERWDAGTSSWFEMTGAEAEETLYPRSFLTPDGNIFIAGSAREGHLIGTASALGTLTTAAISSTNRDYGTAAMYGPGKVIIIGGNETPTNTAETIDLTQNPLTWKITGGMQFARKQTNVVLLPDGTSLVLGGTSGLGFNDESLSVPAAELWNPADGSWSTMAAASVYRGYHSVGVLLPDGRVISSGGVNESRHSNAQYYSPPYLFHGSRPTITAMPASVPYSASFAVTSPDAAGVTRVTLMRLSSGTHGFDQNQRIVELSFTHATGALNVTAPSDPNLAPPGHYMLFLLNGNGVPSVAKIVRLDANAAQLPPAPTSVHAAATSGSAIALDWTDNAPNEDSLRVERSTDGTNFSSIASLQVDSNTFSDSGLQQRTKYYYRVVAVNGAGSSASEVVDATTLGPELQLSPATSLDFGGEPVGQTTSAIAVTITATGAGTLSLGAISTSGDFSQTNNCAATLALGASCAVQVKFSPTASGARTGALSISSNASAPVQVITLSGTGTVPHLGVSATSLAFAEVAVGAQSAAQTVTVSNSGDAPLTISTVTITGPFSMDNQCANTVPPNASCAIRVSFAPLSNGDKTGSVAISTNAGSSTVQLSGTGTAPWLSVSAQSLSFGAINAGSQSSSQTVTVSNPGNASLTITAVAVSGSFVFENQCLSPVAPNGTCAINVTFAPVSGGVQNGTLSVSSNAGNTSVLLNGTGNIAEVAVSVSAITFAPHLLGVGDAKTVQISNNGNAAMTFTAAVSGPFSFANQCSGNLQPGSSCSMQVGFTPVQSGVQSGMLTITSNASVPVVTVPISGTGFDITLVLVRPGRPLRGSAAIAELELAIHGVSGSMAATVSCEASPATVRCTASQGRVQLRGRATRVSIFAEASSPRGMRLRTGAAISGTATVSVKVGGLVRRIQVPFVVEQR